MRSQYAGCQHTCAEQRKIFVHLNHRDKRSNRTIAVAYEDMAIKPKGQLKEKLMRKSLLEDDEQDENNATTYEGTDHPHHEVLELNIGTNSNRKNTQNDEDSEILTNSHNGLNQAHENTVENRADHPTNTHRNNDEPTGSNGLDNTGEQTAIQPYSHIKQLGDHRNFIAMMKKIVWLLTKKATARWICILVKNLLHHPP